LLVRDSLEHGLPFMYGHHQILSKDCVLYTQSTMYIFLDQQLKMHYTKEVTSIWSLSEISRTILPENCWRIKPHLSTYWTFGIYVWRVWRNETGTFHTGNSQESKGVV